jgi:hypothetical protein
MEGAEQKRTRFRKLRIVFSSVCTMVCLLLVALWVRSYWWHEVVTIRSFSGEAFEIAEWQGIVRFSLYEVNPPPVPRYVRTPIQQWLEHEDREWNLMHKQHDVGIPNRHSGFGLRMTPWGWSVFAQHWFPVALFAILTASPWWRFSLRTLLIAMTLIAAVLGILVISK